MNDTDSLVVLAKFFSINHVHSVMVKDFNFTWRAAVGLD